MAQYGESCSTPASFHHGSSDPPPAYTARPHDSAEPSSSSPSSPAFSASQPSAAHASLASLTRGISQVLATNRESQVTNQSREDGEILHCMTTQAADFLADVSSWLSSAPRGPGAETCAGRLLEAELYFTPEAAFSGSGWHSSGAEDRARQGVFVREARIQLPKEKEKMALGGNLGGDEKARRNSGFMDSDWTSAFTEESKGRLWWDDEAQAHRLARCLEAEIKGPEYVSRREIRRSVKAANSWKKGHENTSTDADHVRTTVRAEQMTFRRENEMGLWESQSGWTIVLTVGVAS